jgi:N4-gp56 family major capsid protein
MSSTNFTASDPQTLKLWSRKVWSDSVKETVYGRLIGTSDRSIIQVKDELSKSEGDRVRFGLRALPSGIGVQDEETLEGNEEGLSFNYFDLNLGEKRHAVKVDLNLSAQRTMFNVQSEAKDALTEWCSELLDVTTIEYLTGITQGGAASGGSYAIAATGLPTHTYAQVVGGTGKAKFFPSGYLGGNAVAEFSASRIVYGGTATASANITAADKMSLAVVDKLIEKAKLASPTMRKANFDGKKVWVMLLHPYQVSAMRSNTSTGQWLDIQKALTMGGGKGLLFDEALGIYRDVLFVESTRVPQFLAGAANAIPCARAVFLGAQAGVMAAGREGNAKDFGKLKLAEKTFDYGKRYGIAATFIFGMRRSLFDNQADFAAFAVDTAAAPL